MSRFEAFQKKVSAIIYDIYDLMCIIKNMNQFFNK
jgi:hypothetical protein